jgi:anthranilate phosphoribosyltransferase
MNAAIGAALDRLIERKDLSAEAMRAAMLAIMDGEAAEPEIAALLTALRVKGEAVDELVGTALAMDARALKIPARTSGLLDTCGTGGDRLSTFNISTAAAIVAAGAGVPIAKHGNRGISSSSGSADVLEALGVTIALSPEHVARMIDEIGIGFCFAPLCHGAMKHAAPVRRLLGFRTIFNLVGPLTNPAGAKYQLVGASRPATAKLLAAALARLGRAQAFVVCGAAELDEVSLWGETLVLMVRGSEVSEMRWTAATFGLPECDPGALRVSSPAQSADVIRGVLDGRPGPHRDIVLANTAAGLLSARRADTPGAAMGLAIDAIDSGRAAAVCQQLIDATGRAGSRA